MRWPSVSPTSSNGAPVVVKVVDTRASQRIGYRGMDSKLAEITTEQELVPIFQQKIIDGLTRQGFKATPASGWCFAHTIAHDEEHEYNKDFRLDRFETGRELDEHGTGNWTYKQ